MIGRIMMIAGDPSGDLHGGGVVEELKRRNPDIDVFGIGGDRMKNAGMDLLCHLNEMSFMGFIEVVRHLPFLRRVEKKLEILLDARRPDVVVLIDYPGFNLRFARRAKEHGIPVVYYISPQVWAWGKHRIQKIKELVDIMLVILPFEKEMYEKEGIPVQFVGHPLLDVLRIGQRSDEFKAEQKFDPGKRIIGLFPGSRIQEIDRMLPVMIDAARIVSMKHPVQIGVSKAPNLPAGCYTEILESSAKNSGIDIRLIAGRTYELMKYSDAAVVTSGTATLETACFETPFVVVYRASAISYCIGRILVSVQSIGLVNIVAGKKIVPELIQNDANGRNIAETVNGLLEDAGRSRAMRAELAQVKGMLGVPGAAARVADVLMNVRPDGRANR